MGFPISIIELIYECISTPTFSIMVDGRLEGFLPSNRGLQPIIALFVLCGNGIFLPSYGWKVLDGHLQSISTIMPNITHLLYVDDIMVFLYATTDNAIYVWIKFSLLEDTVGLKINQPKSQIFLAKGSIKNKKLPVYQI